MAQDEINTHPKEPDFPPPPKSKKVNYYFLFGCIAALTASVATSATLIALSSSTSASATALFASAAAITSGVALAPFAALAAVIGGMCLLPLLFSGCFSTRNYHVVSSGMFSRPGTYHQIHDHGTHHSHPGVHHGHF